MADIIIPAVDITDRGDAKVIAWDSDTSTHVYVSNAGAAFTLIETIVLASPAATITFDSIPGTYSHLEVVGICRHAGAGSGFNGLRINFNNDTAGNYGWVETSANMNDSDTTATVLNGDYAGATSGFVGMAPATDVEADFPASFNVRIPGYAGTVFEKTFHAQSVSPGDPPGTGSVGMMRRAHAGVWRNTAAITEIDITNTADANFIVGSSFWLYGLS